MKLLNTLNEVLNGGSTPTQRPPSYRRWADSTVSTVFCGGIEAFSKSAHKTRAVTRARARAVWFLSPTQKVLKVLNTPDYVGIRGVEWVLSTQHFQRGGVEDAVTTTDAPRKN